MLRVSWRKVNKFLFSWQVHIFRSRLTTPHPPPPPILPALPLSPTLCCNDIPNNFRNYVHQTVKIAFNFNEGEGRGVEGQAPRLCFGMLIDHFELVKRT